MAVTKSTTPSVVPTKAGQPLISRMATSTPSTRPFLMSPIKNRDAASAPLTTFSAARLLPPPSVCTRTLAANTAVSSAAFPVAQAMAKRDNSASCSPLDGANLGRSAAR